MESETRLFLISVAEAVADGVQVDWDGLIASRPEMADQLSLLRLQQSIIVAHGELRTETKPPARKFEAS